VWNERAHYGRVTSEDFQGNNSSGAAAEDGRGLFAQMLDQASDIIGVGLEPMTVVLQPNEFTPGKAASTVDDNGVVRRQMFGHPPEAVGCATGPRDHEHNRAAAVGLLVETSPRNFENSRSDLALRVGLRPCSAPRGQRQNGHCG
jgi:hypothetical protein